MQELRVDLYAQQINSPLKNAPIFGKYLGGCAGNIAVGTSRLGLNSAILSRVGTDEMGQYLRQILIEENVDVLCLKSD